MAPTRPSTVTAPTATRPDGPTREDVRGIATAIARAESTTVREDLGKRLDRLEERLVALESLASAAAAPAPPPVRAAATQTASAPTFAPVPANVQDVPVVFAPTTASPTPRPTVDLAAIAAAGHEDIDVSEFGGRRRKWLAMVFVLLLVAGVGGIVVAAMISQALNNHTK